MDWDIVVTAQVISRFTEACCKWPLMSISAIYMKG